MKEMRSIKIRLIELETAKENPEHFSAEAAKNFIDEIDSRVRHLERMIVSTEGVAEATSPTNGAVETAPAVEPVEPMQNHADAAYHDQFVELQVQLERLKPETELLKDDIRSTFKGNYLAE
ncbi:MAG: hypothetical protein ACREYE_00630 [Gammaproteobacteria bacterium]